jgi:DoxX-like protein
MSALTAKRTYRALGLFQAGDAVACAIPLPFIVKVFDDLGVPENLRRVVPPVKAASAVGLLAASRYPWLARLTTAMLTVYFVLAVGAHVRAKDKPVNAIPAVAFLVTYAAMTVKGPSVRA